MISVLCGCTFADGFAWRVMKFVLLPQVIPIAGDVSTYSNYLQERADKKKGASSIKLNF